MNAVLKQIGTNLKMARKVAKLRQVDVAKISGIAYRHYQSIEAGRINVSIDTLHRLAKATKVDLIDLMYHTDVVAARDLVPAEAV